MLPREKIKLLSKHGHRSEEPAAFISTYLGQTVVRGPMTAPSMMSGWPQ